MARARDFIFVKEKHDALYTREGAATWRVPSHVARAPERQGARRSSPQKQHYSATTTMADAPAEAGSSIDGAAAPVTIMSQLKWMEEAEEEVRAQAFDARETCVADPSRIMCVGGTGRLGSSHQGDAWCAREACGERSGTFASPRACRCRQRFFLLTKPHARSHDRRATSGWAAGKWCYGSRASCTRRRALSATRRLQRTRCVCVSAHLGSSR